MFEGVVLSILERVLGQCAFQAHALAHALATCTTHALAHALSHCMTHGA